MIDFIQSLRNPFVYLMWTLVLMYVTWILYGWAMHLKKVKDNLHPAVKVLAAPGIIFAYACDVALNVMVTPYFGDIPREWLLTDRLQRYRKAGGRKAWKAHIICTYLLNPLDPDHC